MRPAHGMDDAGMPAQLQRRRLPASARRPVLAPPFLRPLELCGPDAAMVGAGLPLLGTEAAIGNGKAGLDHSLVQGAPAHLAEAQQAIVLVTLGVAAREAADADQPPKLRPGCLSAVPVLAVAAACLAPLGGVDPHQPDLASGDLQAIAVDDVRPPRDLTRLLVAQQEARADGGDGEDGEHEHHPPGQSPAPASPPPPPARKSSWSHAAALDGSGPDHRLPCREFSLMRGPDVGAGPASR